MSCCDEHNCRRKQPVLVRRGPFSGQWIAITRHKRHDEGDRRPGMIEALEKHTLPPETQAEIELGSSVMRAIFEWTKDAYKQAENGSEAEIAYRAVLDRFQELTEAKKTELIGPREQDAS